MRRARILVAALVLGAAACSSGGDSSDRSGTTSTTDFVEQQQQTNLATFARDVENRDGSSIAVAYGSPAQRWAQFLQEYDRDGKLTVRQVGDDYQVCGVGQPGGGCATLSGFTFSGGNQVQAFDYDGTPIDDLVGGDGPTAELNSGKIAGVELRETFLNPKERRLYVAMSVLWNPEVSPDTTGCDPKGATYSQGGPVADPVGGGQASDSITDTWLMTMSFPDASYGGQLEVSCFRRDGASERFTFILNG